MEGITSTQTNQSVSTATGTKKTATESVPSDEFDKALRSLLHPDQAENVSEEDLFAALVQERVKKVKGDETATEFSQLVTECGVEVRRPNGFVSAEDATKLALRKLRDSEKLSTEEANSIYSQSFAAAQLDGNTDALFDSRGDENDPTKAVMSLEQALLAARTKIQAFESDSSTLTTRDLNEESFGHNGLISGSRAAGSHSEGGSAGFLYKPVSDSDSKLAILLPTNLTGQIDSVTLMGPDGQLIETGRYAGNGNGGRDHFRFSQAGGSYPDNLSVEVKLTSGEVIKYLIADSATRTENPSSSAGAPSDAAPNDDSEQKPSKPAKPVDDSL